jgi:hypothetical protein
MSSDEASRLLARQDVSSDASKAKTELKKLRADFDPYALAACPPSLGRESSWAVGDTGRR